MFSFFTELYDGLTAEGSKEPIVWTDDVKTLEEVLGKDHRDRMYWQRRGYNQLGVSPDNVNEDDESIDDNAQNGFLGRKLSLGVEPSRDRFASSSKSARAECGMERSFSGDRRMAPWIQDNVSPERPMMSQVPLTARLPERKLTLGAYQGEDETPSTSATSSEVKNSRGSSNGMVVDGSIIHLYGHNYRKSLVDDGNATVLNDDNLDITTLGDYRPRMPSSESFREENLLEPSYEEILLSHRRGTLLEDVRKFPASVRRGQIFRDPHPQYRLNFSVRGSNKPKYAAKYFDYTDCWIGHYFEKNEEVWMRTCCKQLESQKSNYRINGRYVQVYWAKNDESSLKTKEQPEVRDGFLKQPFIDYIENLGKNEKWDQMARTDLDKVERQHRLSFTDATQQMGKGYTRIEAMRIAKEQAKVRQLAAQLFWNSNGNCNLDRFVQQYKAWHRAQLRNDDVQRNYNPDSEHPVEQKTMRMRESLE